MGAFDEMTDGELQQWERWAILFWFSVVVGYVAIGWVLYEFFV